MGKYVYIGVLAFGVLLFGMLIYPTIHSMVNSISVAGFLPITNVGMIFLSYAFIFFMFYAVYTLVKGR